MPDVVIKKVNAFIHVESHVFPGTISKYICKAPGKILLRF